MKMSGNNGTRVIDAANTMEARYIHSIRLRYSTYDALARNEYGGEGKPPI